MTEARAVDFSSKVQKFDLIVIGSGSGLDVDSMLLGTGNGVLEMAILFSWDSICRRYMRH